MAIQSRCNYCVATSLSTTCSLVSVTSVTTLIGPTLGARQLVMSLTCNCLLTLSLACTPLDQ
jgi:hypothetical protein